MKNPGSAQKKLFERIKKGRIKYPLSFALVFLLDAALLKISVVSPGDACMAFILIGLVSLFGFVWMGVNEPKKLFVLVSVLFLTLSPIYTIVSADAMYEVQYPDHLDPDQYTVSEIGVSPYVGSAERQEFNFTAVIHGPANDTNVYLNIMDGRNLDMLHPKIEMDRYNDTASNRTIFYVNYELEPGTYTFNMTVYQNGEKANGPDTFYYYGPQNLEEGSFILTALPYMTASLFMNISGLTYILVGMYWWTLIARNKRKGAMTIAKPTEGNTIKCPVCEQALPYGTETCPYCGAEIEYEEASPDENKAEEPEDDEKVEEADDSGKEE